jgi:ADP-ribose pyrophosphatase YjhB (NUDIX family)
VLECAACGFVYYFNPTVAAAAFVRRPDGRVLFIRRAREPAQGKLAIPGGFVDLGETAEEALGREIQEEVGLELVSVEYLCSQTNQYDYKGVTYPVVDLFFTALARDATRAAALDGVASLWWLAPEAVEPAEMAFPSMRAALRVYSALNRRPPQRAG